MTMHKTTIRAGLSVLVAATTVVGATVEAGAAAVRRTSRVSSAAGGGDSDGDSGLPSVSADGGLIAFQSYATDLVADDDNGERDIFVRDKASRTTVRASVNSAGAEADGDSMWPAMSGDGRYVVFTSDATNLVLNDTNDSADIFVRDLVGERTFRVSIGDDEGEAGGSSVGASVSEDGRYVAFTSYAPDLVAVDNNGVPDVFVRDRAGMRTWRVSVRSDGHASNGVSSDPSISADGRLVAFVSTGSNLVADDTNGVADVFIHNLDGGGTRRLSVSSRGRQGNSVSLDPSISGSGRHVVFSSVASNLASGDSNGVEDVFMRDRKREKTRRMNVSDTGEQGNGLCRAPVISADGRYVVFMSYSSTLVSGPNNGLGQILVRDRTNDTTRVVSLSEGGAQGGGDSDAPSVSADGQYVAFHSVATDLVSADTNGERDVFLRRRW